MGFKPTLKRKYHNLGEQNLMESQTTNVRVTLHFSTKTNLPEAWTGNSRELAPNLASVKFARAQVVSLVWVCGNILWKASSSKAFL